MSAVSTSLAGTQRLVVEAPDEYDGPEDPGYVRCDVRGQAAFAAAELDLSAEEGATAEPGGAEAASPPGGANGPFALGTGGGPGPGSELHDDEDGDEPGSQASALRAGNWPCCMAVAWPARRAMQQLMQAA
jgi:hypothetical protein